jgi:hypothetical protein
LETCRKARNAAIESFNTDSRIINNQQHTGDTFSSYILSLADNVNINNNNTGTQKYNPNTAIIIVPYNLCHKFISQLTKMVREI